MTATTGKTAAGAAAGVWADPAFVERWVAGDTGPEALRTPRAMTTLIADSRMDVRHVVNVGAGPGTYLRVLLDAFPAATGVWIDASEAMLERARTALADLEPRVRFEVGDLRAAEDLPLKGDVVLTSRAVHHFRPDTIRGFYGAAASSLSPGGSLCNLDHFATPWRETYQRVEPGFVPRSGGGTESHDHDAPPQPIGDHLAWLRDAGSGRPDVPWRLFWTALVVETRAYAGYGVIDVADLTRPRSRPPSAAVDGSSKGTGTSGGRSGSKASETIARVESRPTSRTSAMRASSRGA